MQDFDAQPILVVVRTISGLCKNFLQRMHLEKAEEGHLFNEEALKKLHAVESGELLSVVKCKQDQANIRMTMINYLGEKVYDPKDRPAKRANEALAIVNKIIGDANEHNYLRAKAIAMVGKTELVQKNQEKAEELMMAANI